MGQFEYSMQEIDRRKPWSRNGRTNLIECGSRACTCSEVVKGNLSRRVETVKSSCGIFAWISLCALFVPPMRLFVLQVLMNTCPYLQCKFTFLVTRIMLTMRLAAPEITPSKSSTLKAKNSHAWSLTQASYTKLAKRPSQQPRSTLIV